MDEKIAHLGFIQAIVNRMGNNSFLIKGWSVTLVVALFALAAKETNKTFMLLALFAALLFWWLDAYILHQERLFRALYQAVRLGKVQPDYSLNTDCVAAEVSSLCDVMFSMTLLVFHGLIGLLVVFAMFALS